MVSTADLVPLSYLILRFLSRGENKLQTNSKQERQKRVKEMAVTKNWFNLVRRKFIRHSHRDITILHSPRPSDEAFIREGILISESRDALAAPAQFLTQEDIAAIKIQAVFRGHLARQAFRALKSLVKLQALVRGSYVRAQSRLALHCMHALTRLQVRVRARQLLSQYGDD